MSFLLGTVPSLALAPLLVANEGSALSAVCKSCKLAFDKECLWVELIVEHFAPALRCYRDAVLDCLQDDTQVGQPGQPGIELLAGDRLELDELAHLCEGGARQAYRSLKFTNCEPFVLQPRARLILEIHELRDWNRHQRRLLNLRQAESISKSLADHLAGQRLQQAILPETLELIALQAVVAGGGKIARPSPKLQEGMAWSPDMEQALVQILERRAQQRRNWFRKQREFLLQDLRWEDWSSN
mmetsp:Transcript_13984/g.26111  ORF Transcript_13984/g.26111 Transcript_13984/m.26111 type:complete len:242 (-) Transcript_13984:114-839(-)